MPDGLRARGTLRIYLGAAPGVGKTFAMLNEAHRRAGRGTDVVAAVVETHGRSKTAELLDGLELIPPKEMVYRGTAMYELDVDAVLERRPALVLIDEMAHTNARRWPNTAPTTESPRPGRRVSVWWSRSPAGPNQRRWCAGLVVLPPSRVPNFSLSTWCVVTAWWGPPRRS
ncbi:sensor histidine kinase KdpD [Mycobacteroides abscessus subsp. abscessus]|nr:sensor histidine kinase KdpD [Mycobacteroides abscessus subsp. abscessus]